VAHETETTRKLAAKNKASKSAEKETSSEKQRLFADAKDRFGSAHFGGALQVESSKLTQDP
jgi:hypothetical protein